LLTLDKLNKKNINPRRYFFPSLDKLPFVNSAHCEVSNDIASRVLCLPLYVGLEEKEQIKIIILINKAR
jgi:dTDP-4-amino-4,6-dideoxygalactose transaminase